MANSQKSRKKKEKKNIPVGKVYIEATFNNTRISITDPQGNLVAWSSAGSKGFKGSRKSTPFAAQIAAEDAAQKAIEAANMKEIIVANVKGPGAGRESALRAIGQTMKVNSVCDTTPIPHNGCRPRKKRRV